MKKIFSFKDYLLKRFGFPMQRITFDPHLSCPHRNADGTGGCVFCSSSGSRAQHLSPDMTLFEQLEHGKKYLKRRYGTEGPYIAYFQAFTTTNAPAETLRKLYLPILEKADFRMVIFATRPDCLPDETLVFLEELSSRYEVWVELGVQTSNDDTLERIHRGHHFDAVERACGSLDARKIRIAAHVILGLPGETPGDYLNTAHAIAKLPFSAVKMHHLLILRDTPLAQMFENNLVHPMNEYEYAENLSEFLHELPEGMIVMRLCSSASGSEVIAPKWWMDKTAFSEEFSKAFERGSSVPETLEPVQMNDENLTLYHPLYHEYFHTPAVSEKKFIRPCRLQERLASGKGISILDIGSGMGFNLCSAVNTAQKICTNPKQKLYLTTLENDPAVFEAAKRLPEHPGKQIICDLAEKNHSEGAHYSIDLIRGDARDSVVMLYTHFDCIFLDGFSEKHNPELWTSEFLAELKNLLKDDGVLVSASTDPAFRGALIENDFLVYDTKFFGEKTGGTLAALQSTPFFPPLDAKTYEIASLTTSGIPYRDPKLRSSRKEILERRKKEILSRHLEGMPKWYKKKL